ncbi:MAG TPA: site-specific integrase [Gaiellaceae bacterium]|nr:site-specific integrase [Gaiellaceae bacterium]
MASFAAGGGKSAREVYRVAVRLLTRRSSAISASPTTGSATERTPRPYDERERAVPEEAKYGYDIDILLGHRNLALDELAEAYEASITRQGRAPATLKKYVPIVRAFLGWADLRADRLPTTFDIDLFLSSRVAELEKQIGRCPRRSTVRAQIAALRSFFVYLERSGLLVDAGGHAVTNPMTAVIAPTVEQRPNDFLRPFEDAALLECASPPAERIVVWLLRWAGLRVAEACALRLQDVDLTPESEILVVRKSKTSAGVRTIPLVPCLVPELQNWLSVLSDRGITSPQAHLLATNTGSAFRPTFVWRLVKRAGARAEVRPVPCECGSRRSTRHDRGCPRTVTGENLSAITPHTLRRTFGSYLLNRGLRLEVVSRLLGHSSTVVTERAYAELLAPTIRDELLAVLSEGR